MKLLAGPFYGEFGHEVLNTGLLRARIKEDDFDVVAVCSRPSRRALWDGIATEFIPHDIQCVGRGNCATDETEPTKEKVLSYVGMDSRRFTMRDCGEAFSQSQILSTGIYQRLGEKKPEWDGVVAVHARNRQYRPERNWPMESWEKLVAWILKEGRARQVVCVGTMEQARFVPRCKDMRDSGLKTQMDIAASAKCAVGSSSGWMHLASLCGCPHLTWVGGQPHGYVRRRYEDRWNPLRTPVCVLPERTWNPSVETVQNALAVPSEAPRK